METESPLLSVVIPTYARAVPLATCLKAIAGSAYPIDRFEVIIVDDGSDAPMDTVVNPYRDTLNIKLIRQQNAGPASARNRGAEKARGHYLVFTDDDCIPSADWLSVLADEFSRTPDRLLGGKTLNALPENLYSSASQALIDFLYDYHNGSSRHANFFASNNIAMPRQRFLDLGCFDTQFPDAAAEDREFCYRWMRAGWSMRYVPHAKIFHAHGLTFRSFLRQHFRYGRGARIFHRVHAKHNGSFQPEPLSFYVNLVRYPFAHCRVPRCIVLATLMLASQVANAFGFFYEMSRNRAVLPGTKQVGI